MFLAKNKRVHLSRPKKSGHKFSMWSSSTLSLRMWFLYGFVVHTCGDLTRSDHESDRHDVYNASSRPSLDILYVAPSEIHGKGVFSSAPFQLNHIICHVFDFFETHDIHQRRIHITFFGSYINHSFQPNTKVFLLPSPSPHSLSVEYYLVAIRFIPAKTEITANYNDTPPFIAKADPSWH